MRDNDEQNESQLRTAALIPDFEGVTPCHALHKPAPLDDRDSDEEE